MTTTPVNPNPATVSRHESLALYAGYTVLAMIVVAWAFRAFRDPFSYDTNAAYEAGALAWKNGHPEALVSWTGTPFLAALMALVSRVLSAGSAGYAVTAVNVVLAGGAIALILRRTRPLIPGRWWWVLAFGLISFGPLMSSVWMKQFNLICLVGALGGVDLLRRSRQSAGAAVIGFSVALKPMLILLPLVLLVSRATRRAGVISIAWIAALNVVGQVLLAVRAHSVHPLSPYFAIHNFIQKTPSDPIHCLPVNFSPASLLCRAIGGAPYPTVQRILAVAFVLLLGLWVLDALRGRHTFSWEVVAFTCALSVMLSPIEWPHYQIMLAPLLVVLLIGFVRAKAGAGSWLGLIAAFVLASLVWQPYGTLPGSISHVLTGARETHDLLGEPPGVAFQQGLAQFAQYILVITAALWFTRRRYDAGVPAGEAAAPEVSSPPAGREGAVDSISRITAGTDT